MRKKSGGNNFTFGILSVTSLNVLNSILQFYSNSQMRIQADFSFDCTDSGQFYDICIQQYFMHNGVKSTFSSYTHVVRAREKGNVSKSGKRTDVVFYEILAISIHPSKCFLGDKGDAG